jgi:HNH endonuclease
MTSKVFMDMPTSAQSAGGIATGIKLRKAALDLYNANPNRCKNCDRVIEVEDGQPVREARVKQFCNHVCAATVTNANRTRVKIVRPKKPRPTLVAATTKAAIFAARKNWQSARSSIRAHAGRVFNLSGLTRECAVCGYSEHVEVCHILSVGDFDENATIAEINARENLVALCPNHHWEFDNGVLIYSNGSFSSVEKPGISLAS